MLVKSAFYDIKIIICNNNYLKLFSVKHKISFNSFKCNISNQSNSTYWWKEIPCSLVFGVWVKPQAAQLTILYFLQI